MTNQAEKQGFPDWCEAQGITITCEPLNKPPHDPKWQADGWSVALNYQGRTLTTDYWCGIGHREWSPMERLADGSKGASVQSVDMRSDYAPSKGWRALQGTDAEKAKQLPYGIQPTLHNVTAIRFRPKAPSAPDVLHSLLNDAMGVENGQSFEDWCGEYGYDTDSRKAEATYKECQAIALKLRGFLSDIYDAARDASQDY